MVGVDSEYKSVKFQQRYDLSGNNVGSEVLRAGGIRLHNATTIKQRAITTLEILTQCSVAILNNKTLQ